MSLSIQQNETSIDYYIERITTLKKSTDLPLNTVDTTSQDSVEISEDAKLQYNYMMEIESSNNVINEKQPTENNADTSNTFLSNDSINPEFIENYSLKYAQMRKEISEESSPDEVAKKIDLLDKAYNDAVNNAAESLASGFQSFFDYAANKWRYNTSEDDSNRFDTESFKNNIISLANEAFSVVKKAFKDNNFDNLQANIENKLSSIQSGTTVETMNYTDIKEVDNFLKSIPKFKDHIKEYSDDGTYRPVSNNWSTADAAEAINKEYTMAKDFLKSSNASDFVKKKVYNTVLKNISAYHKSFAFRYQTDQNQGEINKDRSNYKLLKDQYDNFEKKLEAARKKNNMKMVIAYLELLSGLKAQLTEALNKLNADMKTQNELSQNPNSVVNTDAYKDISSREIFAESDN